MEATSIDEALSPSQSQPPQPPPPSDISVAAEEPEEEDEDEDEDDALISKAQKFMEFITSSPDNPNPKALHALASLLETQESRFFLKIIFLFFLFCFVM